jgi:hypothetical protein
MSLHCDQHGGAIGVAATLGDHLAAQGAETSGLYVRGARVKKRESASEPPAPASTEFLSVRVEPPTEAVQVAVPSPEVRCSIRHSAGHVLEFGELPNPTWLAALWSAIK